MRLELGPGEVRARTPKQSKVGGLTSWETRYAPDFRMPAHAHENAFLYLVLEGALTERCDRQTRTALPATVIFHPPRQVHANHFLDAGARAFNLELDARWLDRLQGETMTLDEPAYFQGGRVAGLAAQLHQETRQTDAASALVVEGLFLELLGETARRGAPLAERKPPRWLQQAKELLHERFAAGLTLEEIAAAVGVHPVYLSTMFRQQFGCTIGDTVRRLRIDDACCRLIWSQLPLAEIALEAGFANQSHFSRTFKRLTGLTPSEYRRAFRS
jgi:AraC family transcriptional regulator